MLHKSVPKFDLIKIGKIWDLKQFSNIISNKPQITWHVKVHLKNLFGAPKSLKQCSFAPPFLLWGWVHCKISNARKSKETSEMKWINKTVISRFKFKNYHFYIRSTDVKLSKHFSDLEKQAILKKKGFLFMLWSYSLLHKGTFSIFHKKYWNHVCI